MPSRKGYSMNTFFVRAKRLLTNLVVLRKFVIRVLSVKVGLGRFGAAFISQKINGRFGAAFTLD